MDQQVLNELLGDVSGKIINQVHAAGRVFEDVGDTYFAWSMKMHCAQRVLATMIIGQVGMLRGEPSSDAESTQLYHEIMSRLHKLVEETIGKELAKGEINYTCTMIDPEKKEPSA